MMDNAFTKHDMGWKIRYASAQTDSSISDSWREFFGDEYNWTSLVPLAWAALGGPEARLNPPKLRTVTPIFELASWWSAPLHLMAYGLGWTNLGKGLKLWREAGYPVENEVLRLLYNTYGPSIEGLEHWLNRSSSAGEINSRLYEVANQRWGHIAFSRDEAETRAQHQHLLQQLSSGPRHRLMRPLVENPENDPLHLANHFAGSIAYWGEAPMKVEVFADERGDSEVLLLDRYQGSMSVLTARFNLTGWLEGAIHFKRVRVDIKGLGTIGTYVYCGPTGRTFRLNDQRDEHDFYGSAEREMQWHMLGN